ncbi:hypothetical protein A3Q56_04780 [Intoshia linei]|uniref:Uncharacterized protein n=1 Tax=Intoshia linei TaxID=1819745 RepID=A0A177B048_9BILA|nr:hypothetical protein A3Q56_04780 [Intoshia linei]
MKILNQDKDVNTESIKSKIIDIPSEKLETADIDIIKDETNKMLDVTDSTFDLKIEKREDNENMPVLDESSFTSEFDIIDDSVNSNKAHNTEKAFANSKIDDSFDLIPGKIESVKDIECLDKETFSNMNESNINNSTINELSEFEQIEASKCENICEKYSENNRVTYPITEDTNRIVNAAVDIFQNLSTECATCPEKNISNCHFSSAATDYKSYPHARNHIMPNTTIRTDSVISERVIPPKQQTTNGNIDYGTCSSAMNDKSYFYNEPNSNKFIKCEKPVNQFDLYRYLNLLIYF